MQDGDRRLPKDLKIRKQVFTEIALKTMSKPFLTWYSVNNFAWPWKTEAAITE